MNDDRRKEDKTETQQDMKKLMKSRTTRNELKNT